MPIVVPIVIPPRPGRSPWHPPGLDSLHPTNRAGDLHDAPAAAWAVSLASSRPRQLTPHQQGGRRVRLPPRPGRFLASSRPRQLTPHQQHPTPTPPRPGRFLASSRPRQAAPAAVPGSLQASTGSTPPTGRAVSPWLFPGLDSLHPTNRAGQLVSNWQPTGRAIYMRHPPRPGRSPWLSPGCCLLSRAGGQSGNRQGGRSP